MLASLWIETFTSATALSLRLFASNLRLARNLHQAAVIPWLPETGTAVANRAARSEERQALIEIERDGRVGIDLKFGSITFKQEGENAFAIALVDVIVDGAEAPPGGTRLQMEVKVAADPDTDSILGVTERCRARIVAILRAAADTFDGLSARAILFERTG